VDLEKTMAAVRKVVSRPVDVDPALVLVPMNFDGETQFVSLQWVIDNREYIDDFSFRAFMETLGG